ncbi:ABC transporter B family member 9-like isoform X2 [Mercurialis annua]|uniref:ABC transporter B family member 9-like isoform X2 n=1 Tax=Mercurialis annua TaxID=3986 RepID=UPI00216082BA|nr:ABC transporter B family member 9-like isoform X2 [Mercurialis annua]
MEESREALLIKQVDEGQKGRGEGKEEKQELANFFILFIFADRVDIFLMIIGTICAIAHGISGPLMTLIFSQLINSFGNAHTSTTTDLSKIVINYVYLAVGSGIASFLNSSCWMITGERQSVRIRGLYLKSILRQEIGFFDTEMRTGEVIERMFSNNILIRDTISEMVGKLIQLVSTFIGGFVIAFVKGWHLALVLLVSVPVMMFNYRFLTVTVSKLVLCQIGARMQAGNIVEQTIGAIRMVASFTGEKHAIAKYNEKLKIVYEASTRQGLALGLGVGTIFAVLFGSYGFASWYGSKLIMHNDYNGGQVIGIIIATTSAAMALAQASSFMRKFSAGKAAAHKMFETIKRESKIDPSSITGMVLQDIKGEIEFKDVYFKYPSRPDVEIFSGLSLHVGTKTTLAIVGESGSGKSTVISLIERFYDPDSGEILVDGFNLNNLKISWLREQIGLVSQEPILFATSIKENIAYGKENATDEDIRSAIELANAAEFVDKLPKGLGTIVGERGCQLSGGQKQRIAIARAIVKNPKILLLDEPTSALDTRSEHIIQEALIKVMSNRTTIVVAHRLTTIKNADEIAVFSLGKILEKGTHEELIQNKEGAYSQLVRLQHVEDPNSHAKILEEASDCTNGVSSSDFFIPKTSNMHDTEDDDERISTNKINKKPTKVSLKRLAYLSKPELPALLLGSIGAIIYGIAFPVFGFLNAKSIVMFYEPPKMMQKDSIVWAVLFMILGVITLVGSLLQNYFLGIAGGKLIERISSMSFGKVVNQEISWFDDPANSSGAVSARLSTNATTIEAIIGEAFASAIRNIATILAALFIAFTANWILAFVVIAVSPLLFFQGYVNFKYMNGFSSEEKDTYEQASKVAHEAVSNMRTIASFCAEKKVTDLYEKKCRGPKEQGVRNGFLRAIGTVADSNGMSLDISRAMEAIASAFSTIDGTPKIDSSSDQGVTPLHIDGNIDFHSVNFTYSTRPDIQIFKNLSFSIPAKKVVAIVGESGSGKSTIINLIERFYDPDSGYIYFDGLDIKGLNVNWLRQQIGLVSQEAVVFNESIRTNIAYGKQEHVSEEEIIEAANAANAHKFISSLPEGYNTCVGEKGVQLSGGQKQRIAIARAILKKPKILLLDEATSALDAESEHAVQVALQNVMVDKTTIVVSHRLAFIRKSDIIFVLKNGVLVEQGSHDVLMNLPNGSYASLVAYSLSK